jgi:hypothetical protein
MNTTFRDTLVRIFVVALMFGSGATQLAQAAATAAPTAATAGPVIDGFRDAKFGMTEAQVRSTIAAEFKLPASAITATENQLQRTTVLGIQIPNLVPQGGIAAISYVFGYQSHKLMEVNILWSPEIDPNTTPHMLYQNGETAAIFRQRKLPRRSQHRQHRDAERRVAVSRHRRRRQCRSADPLRHCHERSEDECDRIEPYDADLGLCG